jgi:site-specific DNA-methyltransferase (adenine-specific)
MNNNKMDLNNLSKEELLLQCEKMGILKCKSKNKNKLIELISNHNNNNNNKPILIIEDSDDEENIVINNNSNIDVKNTDGISYLKTIPNGSIDLILTDPPYIISKDTGMNEHYNNVKFNEENNIDKIKTEEEWEIYKNENNIDNDINKENFIKYGTIYGKKYCVKTDYGDWDNNFTMENLEEIICEYYKKLKKGGTLIMFFDLWKITDLKNILEKYKFKQIRFIEWIKTNPQPRNSKVNYLTNCREIALIGVKDGNPTFNSSYDNGIYMFPLQGGKNRFHPTQKSLALFEELIKKHSNENDTVLDTFLGSGTTAIACKNLKRKFKGCEISKEYYDKITDLIN